MKRSVEREKNSVKGKIVCVQSTGARVVGCRGPSRGKLEVRVPHPTPTPAQASNCTNLFGGDHG